MASDDIKTDDPITIQVGGKSIKWSKGLVATLREAVKDALSHDPKFLQQVEQKWCRLQPAKYEDIPTHTVFELERAESFYLRDLKGLAELDGQTYTSKATDMRALVQKMEAGVEAILSRAKETAARNLLTPQDRLKEAYSSPKK